MKLAVLLVVLAVGLAGCTRDAVRRHAEDALSQTTPAGAERPFLPVPTRDGTTVEYTWMLRIDSAWPVYVQWVTGQLSRTFTCRDSEHEVACVRTLGGDSFMVRLIRPDPNVPRDVRAVFTARPN